MPDDQLLPPPPKKNNGQDGILPPPPKKKLKELGGLGSKIGGKATISAAPSVEGKAPFSEAAAKIGVPKTQTDEPDLNKQFAEITGYDDFPLPSAAKRDILNNQLLPVASAVRFGSVTPKQLKDLHQTAYGKKFVENFIAQELPDVDTRGLSVPHLQDIQFEKIAAELQDKNRTIGVAAQNQVEFQLDNELANAFKTFKYGSTSESGGYDPTSERASGEPVKSEFSFGEVNTTSVPELYSALKKTSKQHKIWDAEGNEVDKKGFLNKIQQRMFQVKSQDPLTQELVDMSDKIRAAVEKVPVEWKKKFGANPTLVDKDAEYVKLGLNFLADTEPGEYKAILGAIETEGQISEQQYNQLVTLGLDMKSYKDFKSGERMEDDDRNFMTPQLKTSGLAGWLSEELKRKRKSVNRFYVKDKDIVEAFKDAPEELKDEDALNMIRLKEAVGDGIVGAGVISKTFRDIAQPFESIINSANVSIKSPFKAYLDSKNLVGKGQILIPQKGGGYGTELKSETILNKAIGGFFQMLTQAAIARGLGVVSKGVVNPFLPGRVAPITTSQAALSFGTPASILAQTYGGEYIDFLEKTGDPNKAALGAFTSSLAQGWIEKMVLPDVKLAEDIVGGLRRNFAKEIINVIEKGGGKVGVANVVKDFAANVTKTLGKEAIIEETSQNAVNYLTEQIISPQTAIDRNLAKESGDIAADALVSMSISSLIGGGAQTNVQRQLSKAQLNYIGVNSQKFLESLNRQFQKGEIKQAEYDLAKSIITRHGESVANAPKLDSKHELISANRQLEYAYQNTVAEINTELAANQKDKVLQEPFLKKVEEADKIKRQIFYGEESEQLPPKENEPIVIDQDRDLMDEEESEFTSRPKEQVIADVPKAAEGITNDGVKEAFLTNPEIGLAEVAQQLHSTTGEAETASKTYGNQIADIALELYPTMGDATMALESAKAPQAGVSVIRPEENVPPNVVPLVTTEATPKEPAKTTVSDAEALPVGDVGGGDKKSLNLPNEKTKTPATTEKRISGRPVDETTIVQPASKQGVTGVVHENAAFTEREQGEKRKKSEPVLEDEYGNDIYWHGSDKKIEGQPKVGRSDTVIKTRMGGIPFKDLWDAFYVTTDKLWAEFFSPKRKKVHGVKLKKSAKILDLSGVASESTHLKNKAFLGGNNIKSELPFQKEFEEYGFGWLNKERAKNGAAPLTKEQYLERGFDKGFNPTKEEWWLDEYGQDALVDFIKENGYDAIKFGREIAILNKDIAKFVEQEQSINVGGGVDAAKPPAEPPQATPKVSEGGGRMKDKGILNRLYNAKNTPQAAKEGFEREGLQYETKSQEEAAGVAKAVVESEGIDEAVKLAAAGTFDGDVNSLIFAESLNQLAEQEAAATDPKSKFDTANKFAEVSISYDMVARNQGRFNAAINYFYKKSPLGMVLKANADNKDQFEKIAKNKNESWGEFFDRIKDLPEFKEFVDKKVQTELKKERAESRKKRIEKVRAVFKAAKEKVRKEGGATYATIIPPHIMEAAIEAIELAYEAGEVIATIVQDAVDYISKQIGTTDWDKQKFMEEWKKKLGGFEGKSTPLDKYKIMLKNQLDDLDKQIEEKKRKLANKNKTELDDEAKELLEKREAKRKELERVAPLSKDDEFMMKQLDKFRDKLKGLTELQKDEVIRNSYLHIIQNGGLEQADFRKIVATAMGYGDLTEEQSKKMKEMVADINAVEEFGKKWRTGKTEKSEKEYHNSQLRAAKAAKDLADMFDRKADIPRLLNSIMQGNTLTLTNLFILNPLFNVVNQLAIRFPVSLVNGIIDGVAKAINPKYEQRYISVLGQRSFFGGLWKGVKEGAAQVRTGLNRMDYIQKEIYPDQIRPLKSIQELKQAYRGERKLSKTQVAQRIMQIFPGTFAEFSFRMLNLFDKPQRFAAGAATASSYAKLLGIPSSSMDYKIFMEFPREIAYDEYQKRFYKEIYDDAISKGLSEPEAKKRASEKSAEKAAIKADAVRDAILQEGARSTFQQDNILVDFLNKGKKAVSKSLGGGLTDLAQSTLVSPYIKIPSNAFWSYYNLAHPPIAILQSLWHMRQAVKFKNSGDDIASMKNAREARYWFGHAAVGIAWGAVVAGLVKEGIIVPGNDGEEPKKEREGEFTYQRQGMIDMTKLLVKISGGDPNKVTTSTTIPLKWLGSIGMLFNTMARNHEEMTPEQAENSSLWMSNMLSFYDIDDLKELQNGIFGNTSALINALGSGSRGAERFGLNVIGMYTNILQPASFAQIVRATNPYYSAKRADSFGQQLSKDMAERSWLFRALSGKYPSAKVSIWGEKMKKPEDFGYRFLGWDRVTKDNFAQPIYEDAKKYKSTDFFPPAVSKELNGVKLNAAQLEELEILVGKNRASVVSSYINDAEVIPLLNEKYSKLDPETKKEVLKAQYSLGREFGIAQFYENHKDMIPKGKTVSELVNSQLLEFSKKIMKIRAQQKQSE